MISRFLPALYQPPSPWFPGGSAVRSVHLPALRPNMEYLPGAVGAEPCTEKEAHVESIFLPALMDDAAAGKKKSGLSWLPGARSMPRTDVEDAEHPLHDCPNWLDPRLKGTPAYYPHALIAFPHWRDLQHRRFPEEGFLMGDSGGFTVMTSGVSIDPLEVIRWQLRENCSAGMILDVPPLDKHGTQDFQDGLTKTCANVRKARKLYEKLRRADSPFRWWGIVHGWVPEELELWWKGVSKEYDFQDQGEGWGFKPRPTITPATSAAWLHFISRHKEIRRAHFLMTTGADAVLTLLALGEEAGLEFISYDSSTPIRNATNRLCNHPSDDGLSWDAKQERRADRNERDFLLHDCPCHSCLGMRGELQVWPDLVPADGSWGPYWVFRFAYHNLLNMISTFDNLRRVVEAEKDSRKSLLTVLGPKKGFAVLKAFDTGRGPGTSSLTGSLMDFV